jgi:hypothetical protein
MNGMTKLVELLIIDEAERLTPTALELLRDNHDRTRLGIILIGMPGIDQRFRHYPQLYSRLGFSHRYRPLGRDEVLFVLDRHWKRLGRSLDPDDFTDAQAIAAIERITRGNFRLPRAALPPDHPCTEDQSTRNHHRRRDRSSRQHPRHRQPTTKSANKTPPKSAELHRSCGSSTVSCGTGKVCPVFVRPIDGRVYRNGPIDLPGSIGFGQDPAENLVPSSVGGETTMPLPDGLPGAELRRQVPPSDSTAVSVDNSFDDLAVAPERPPSPTLRAKKQGLDPGPLIIT